MAIENTYLLGKNITLGCGFDLQAKAPLDSRETVPAFAGLQALIDGNAAYEGMIVYDEETKKHYSAQKVDGALKFVEFGINEAELKALIASETIAAMEFKGAATELPSNPAKGDMYKVTGAFKVGEEDAKVGDSIVYDGTQWFIIPSGDDIEDTWRPVTDVDNDATLTFAAGDKIDVAVAANGTVTYSHEAIDAPTNMNEEGDEQTRTYITALITDNFGHIIGFKTATENVENTDTTYTFEGLPETEGEPAPSSVYFQVTSSEEGASAQVIYVDSYSRNEADGKFVAKVDGKQLSTEDFTTALLNKLNGIEEGANKYTHATHTEYAQGFYKVTVDAEGHISNAVAVTKEDIVALGIPAQDTTYEKATDSTDGLMSKEHFAKVEGISEGATKVENVGNGKIKIDGEEVTVYEHPEKHAIDDITDLQKALDDKVDVVDGKGLSTNDFTNELLEKLNGIEAEANKYEHAKHTAAESGLYKVTVDAEGHVSAVTPVTKEDITALDIPAQDTVYTHATHTAHAEGIYKITVDAEGHVSGAVAVTKADLAALIGEASTTEAGLMSAEDKEKVDALGSLASKNEITKDDLAEALATELDDKVAKETGKSLVSDTEITKLATVQENAEPNFIKEVEANEFTVTDGKMSVNTINVTKLVQGEADVLILNCGKAKIPVYNGDIEVTN